MSANKLVTRFVPPHGDKHWSFQMVADELPTTGEFVWAMQDEKVKNAKPFLQGHDGRRWAMVEFWTKDESLARSAALHLATRFDSTLLDGDFTRDELMD